MVFLSSLILFFWVLAKTLAVKSVSDITYSVSSGTLNLHSVNQLADCDDEVDSWKQQCRCCCSMVYCSPSSSVIEDCCRCLLNLLVVLNRFHGRCRSRLRRRPISRCHVVVQTVKTMSWWWRCWRRSRLSTPAPPSACSPSPDLSVVHRSH